MIVARTLPDLITTTNREYDLFPVEAENADYILRIRQSVKGRKERSIYLVQEETVAGPDCAAFLLVNPKGEVYECVFWGRGLRLGYCSCFAGRVHHTCKHRDALEDAITNGADHE